MNIKLSESINFGLGGLVAGLVVGYFVGHYQANAFGVASLLSIQQEQQKQNEAFFGTGNKKG